MSEVLPLLFAFLAGMLLGGLFFGGLWWTVQKGLQSVNPGVWFINSFLVRTGATVTGFYFMGADSWQKLLLMLAGFIISRLLVSHFTKHHQPQE